MHSYPSLILMRYTAATPMGSSRPQGMLSRQYGLVPGCSANGKTIADQGDGLLF
jgi:hypothetical protein